MRRTIIFAINGYRQFRRKYVTARMLFRALMAGWIGGFAGNVLLGVMFSNALIKKILYDPDVQSQLFISLTPQRNFAVSVIGLIVLSGIHGVLFTVLRPSIPGAGWLRKGIWCGVAIWASYWLFQEWFIYVALLGEPFTLAMMELTILLFGAVVEGAVISQLLVPREER